MRKQNNSSLMSKIAYKIGDNIGKITIAASVAAALLFNLSTYDLTKSYLTEWKLPKAECERLLDTHATMISCTAVPVSLVPMLIDHSLCSLGVKEPYLTKAMIGTVRAVGKPGAYLAYALHDKKQSS